MTLDELDALASEADLPEPYCCDRPICKRHRALCSFARDLIAIARAAKKVSEIGMVDAIGPEMQEAVLEMRAALARLKDGGK